jgi:hypothetical protein
MKNIHPLLLVAIIWMAGAFTTLWQDTAFARQGLLDGSGGQLQTAFAFEGRITATLTRGDDTQTWLYTVGTNALRLERAGTNRPHARNIVALDSGAVTLVFPHNRSFMRLKNSGTGVSPVRFNASQTPGDQELTGETPAPLPPGRMPAATASIGPANLPGMPAPPPMPQLPAGIGPQAGGGPMSAMPMMPMMPDEQMELKATKETTNLFGYACARYELRQRNEMMEIWATDKLPPFQAWMQNQRPCFGPQMIEEQWSDLLRAQKLFPLLAVLKFERGPERLRFEVKVIKPEKIEDKVGALFKPPSDYHELEPLPF